MIAAQVWWANKRADERAQVLRQRRRDLVAPASLPGRLRGITHHVSLTGIRAGTVARAELQSTISPQDVGAFHWKPSRSITLAALVLTHCDEQRFGGRLVRGTSRGTTIMDPVCIQCFPGTRALRLCRQSVQGAAASPS